MVYTVHEVAKISGVSIKALYHYHKIGLLIPESIAANGYRYYSDKELKTLQQILFYRELDFSLKDELSIGTIRTVKSTRAKA